MEVEGNRQCDAVTRHGSRVLRVAQVKRVAALVL